MLFWILLPRKEPTKAKCLGNTRERVPWKHHTILEALISYAAIEKRLLAIHGICCTFHCTMSAKNLISKVVFPRRRRRIARIGLAAIIEGAKVRMATRTRARDAVAFGRELRCVGSATRRWGSTAGPTMVAHACECAVQCLSRNVALEK